MSNYDPRAQELAEAILKLFGQQLFQARARAIQQHGQAFVEETGQLMGGKLTIRVEFDERPRHSEHRKDWG